MFWFSDQHGDKFQIHTIQAPRHFAVIDNFIIGVVIGGGLYPIWTRVGNQVLVRPYSGRNVIMTPELHEMYDHYFTPFIPRLRG